jgi:hypothetical protein
MTMKPTLVAAAMILSFSPASSFARGVGGTGFSSSGTVLASPSASQPAFAFTNRGAGTVTGHIGQLTTTTIPGRAGQGVLIPNGNGTSTLIGPGGGISTVQTLR